MQHTIPPIYNEKSRILILGSFPSVKSREEQFFYAHPQNRFWRVLAIVLGCETPTTISEKSAMLLNNGIALWDVIASCDIEGSDDASIKNVVPNDFSEILHAANIKKIYTNGGKAGKLYRKYCQQQTKIPAELLPSTSPANARYSLSKLTDEWRAIYVD
ncbi:MAG: DNA-deoxyinosine glycosylase [Oscillospiraceae bacterium]